MHLYHFERSNWDWECEAFFVLYIHLIKTNSQLFDPDIIKSHNPGIQFLKKIKIIKYIKILKVYNILNTIF